MDRINTLKTSQWRHMGVMVSSITGNSVVCSSACSAINNKQIFIGPHYWSPVDPPHKRPITSKAFPYHEVIMPMPIFEGAEYHMIYPSTMYNYPIPIHIIWCILTLEITADLLSILNLAKPRYQASEISRWHDIFNENPQNGLLNFKVHVLVYCITFFCLTTVRHNKLFKWYISLHFYYRVRYIIPQAFDISWFSTAQNTNDVLSRPRGMKCLM